jgi:hypothetical protein
MMRSLLILIALCLCLSPPAAAQNINDFVPNPNCTTVSTGDVATAGIWSCGHVPGTGEYAQISHSGVTWTSGDITVATLYIAAGASLTGTFTGSCATTHTLTTSNTAYTDTAEYETGIIVRGTLTLTGCTKTPWIRAGAQIASGTSSVTLGSAPSGWANGDRLLLPDSRLFVMNESNTHIHEVLTQSALSGTALTLSGNTAVAHPGARDYAGTVERYPFVGNLTRNVIIKSANAAGTRGHLIVSDAGVLNLNYVAIQDFGRTTNDPLCTVAAAPCDYPGTVCDNPIPNHIGRYSLHLHGVTGASGTSTINGVVVERALKWGITIHGTDSHTITNNIVYDADGWGIGTEAGTEDNNVIDDNLIVQIDGTAGTNAAGTAGNDRGDSRNGCPQGSEQGVNGSGIWLQGNNNRVRRNVIVDAKEYAMTAWGQDAILEMDGNELVSSWVGWSPWSTGAAVGAGTSYIDNTYEWHSATNGIFHYGVRNLTYRNWYGRGDPNVSLSDAIFTAGLWFGDYDAVNVQMLGVNIQNKRTAIVAPYGKSNPVTDAGSAERVFTVEDGVFKNNIYDIHQRNNSLSYDATTQVAFKTVVRRAVHVAGSHGLWEYVKEFLNTAPASNYRTSLTMEVYDENNVATDDFLVWSDGQLGSASMPASAGDVVSCPGSGLTVQQCFDMYGFAVMGAVMPGTALTRTKVYGKVTTIASPAGGRRRRGFRSN